MSKNNEIDTDKIEEARELLKYAIENRSWTDADEAVCLLDEALGYESTDDDDDGARKRNQLEE